MHGWRGHVVTKRASKEAPKEPNTHGKRQSRVCFRVGWPCPLTLVHYFAHQLAFRRSLTAGKPLLFSNKMEFVLLTVFLLACAPITTRAQSCLTQDDVRRMLARVEAPAPAKPDKKLREELLKLANKQRELLLQVVSNDQAKKSDQEKLQKVF